jgi:P-type Ca2+ transporter type 2C
VLLDDDFASIVAAVRLGRRIYDNLRKAMTYILAIHVPIAGLALIPLLFGLPLIFWPLHIAFLELVIDPMCSIVFEAEPEEQAIMQRPPRNPEQPLFSTSHILWSLAQGAVVCQRRREDAAAGRSKNASRASSWGQVQLYVPT